ncbi:SDR family NAD(P)-dependent oxidoreductase [Rhodobacter sp. CZR27]|uniref:SDR family NAD(P)-dependent oxidoreductase n=1 Tax=Rhodobacter sp. CZR27 TaxID=2033869 RepID=UPI000BBEF355|nr:SDR family NAD(P)-dependent oxidoreductase [Rhodobacter sp. CZR27]
MTALLVTGGSGAIGGALCRAAAASRPVWIGFDRNAAQAAALAEAIAAGGGRARTIHLPLHDPATLQASLAGIPVAEAPSALALCGWPAPLVAPLSRQAEDMDRQSAALAGCLALLSAVWRMWWRKAGGGHALAVLTAALGPPAAPHMAAYVAQKGALKSLLDAAAVELGPAGLRISTVSPGYVETPMLAAFDPRLLDRARTAAGGAFLSPDRVAQTLLGALQAPPAAGRVQDLSLSDEVECDETNPA